MAREADWVKTKRLEFNQQIEQSVKYLLAPGNMERMGFGKGSAQEKWITDVFMPLDESYVEAFDAWANESTRTPLATFDVQQEERKVKAAYRQLYKGFLKDNPLVTNGDLQRMAMPERFDGPRQRAPVAEKHPASRADTSRMRVIRVHFGSESAHGIITRKRKPRGQHAAFLRWALSDKPVTRVEELVNQALDTKTPFEISFPDEDRGKFFYY
ncbi:MAG: hypothetical protein LBF09_02025, partial [Odoribacteraceae bacterium]|nr:hypothetical protein [Odoribacteraceae bacterium]